MAVETFDQRFKRLTGDMLMLDICRTLGIEIRELMKIRSGVRVELSTDRLRRLCADQGLDFASFTRDYASPWSAELNVAPVITSDLPPPVKRAAPPRVDAGGAFRGDGSRVAPPPEAARPPETQRTPAGPRMTRLVETQVAVDAPIERARLGAVVGRLKAVVAGAAARLAPEPAAEPDADYPEPVKIVSGVDAPDDRATLRTVLAELGGLRRDVAALDERISRLIGR